MNDPEKIPVEQLEKDDRVRAVAHGPEGVVIDPDRYGWTLVKWGDDVMSYKHGKDRLMRFSDKPPAFRKMSVLLIPCGIETNLRAIADADYVFIERLPGDWRVLKARVGEDNVNLRVLP